MSYQRYRTLPLPRSSVARAQMCSLLTKLKAPGQQAAAQAEIARLRLIAERIPALDQQLATTRAAH
jgi:hypothetical protein